TNRISQLENALQSGAGIKPQKVNNKPAQPVNSKLIKLDPKGYVPADEWKKLISMINEQSPAIGSFLVNSMASIEGNIFKVVVASDFYVKRFTASDDKAILKKIVNDYYGQNFEFKLYSSKSVDIEDKDNPINELLKRAKNAEIEVEIKS
ncbi:MAG: hypothetical protein ACI4RN_04275, partial [Oscillospiraceae bacterium]